MVVALADAEWAELLAQHPPPPPQVRAETFLERLPSFALPALVRCDDMHPYVIKGVTADGHDPRRRALIADHVVARLAECLGAPVPPAMLVNLPAELIALEPQMQHMLPGPCHGSRLVADCIDSRDIRYPHGENVARHAQLCVLYSWLDGNDAQWLYGKAEPHLVYSFDHGCFFPGGPEWTEDDLRNAPPPEQHPAFDICGLDSDTLKQAAAPLKALQPVQIAGVLASVPAAWGLTPVEAVAVSAFAHRRAQQLCAIIDGI